MKLAIVCQTIQESISTAITMLAGRTENGGNRRKQHEMRQSTRSAEFVEIPGSVNFRCKNVFERRPIDVRKYSVLYRSCQMENAAQRRHGFGDFLKQVGHVFS